LQNSKGYRE